MKLGARSVVIVGGLLLIAALIAGASFLAPPPPAAQPFRFAVYGDTRDGHDAHRNIVAQIIKANPVLVLQTGDLVHSGGDASQWKIYDDITGEMRTRFPVYPARGNHDNGGTGFDDRETAPFTSGNKRWYSFDKGNCHFIALSIDEYTPYDANSPQYAWLKADLAAAQNRARHIFVFFHVGPYSIGSHGSDMTVRRTLCPLFEQYGVRAVFTGHDHLYYHTRRNGIHYIVSGGGGAPLYYPDPKKGAIDGDKWERANHYLICDVNGDKIDVGVYRLDGTPIEKFTIAP
jgi:acid phosphatase type 7